MRSAQEKGADTALSPWKASRCGKRSCGGHVYTVALNGSSRVFRGAGRLVDTRLHEVLVRVCGCGRDVAARTVGRGETGRLGQEKRAEQRTEGIVENGEKSGGWSAGMGDEIPTL